MKVFKVWTDDVYWNQYVCAVVVAESEEALRAKFKRYKTNSIWDSYTAYPGEEEDEFRFYDGQGEIHIEEDLTKESVVCTSFCAG